MSDFWKSFLDLGTITGPTFATVAITLGLSLFFILLSFKLKKVDPQKKTPIWLVPFIMVVELINNFIKSNIGKRWKSYAPWFVSLAIYIFISNIAGIFLLESPTSYLLNTLALAMTSFFVIQIAGITSNGFKGYLKGFIEPTPVMLPMNIISEFSLPISLCLRLFGNVVSGAVIGILIKGAAGWFATPVMPLINLVFDIFFGLIQTVVFVILSIIFTSMKIPDEEKIYS